MRPTFCQNFKFWDLHQAWLSIRIRTYPKVREKPIQQCLYVYVFTHTLPEIYISPSVPVFPVPQLLSRHLFPMDVSEWQLLARMLHRCREEAGSIWLNRSNTKQYKTEEEQEEYAIMYLAATACAEANESWASNELHPKWDIQMTSIPSFRQKGKKWLATVH